MGNIVIRLFTLTCYLAQLILSYVFASRVRILNSSRTFSSLFTPSHKISMNKILRKSSFFISFFSFKKITISKVIIIILYGICLVKWKSLETFAVVSHGKMRIASRFSSGAQVDDALGTKVARALRLGPVGFILRILAALPPTTPSLRPGMWIRHYQNIGERMVSSKWIDFD